MNDRKVLTIEAAKELIDMGDYVHVFVSDGRNLIGCDWTKKEIIKLLESADVICESGPIAMSLGHGVAVLVNDSGWKFIATKKEIRDKQE